MSSSSKSKTIYQSASSTRVFQKFGSFN